MYDDLFPPLPATPQHFGDWKKWASARRKENNWELLRLAPPPPEDPAAERFWLAHRAVIAEWKDEPTSPEGVVRSSHRFLGECREAPAFVFRAAERLVDRGMQAGITTPDMLYLTAAFAWPLRDISPAVSDRAWAYLIHAPWQTDSVVLKQLCLAVNGLNVLGHGRTLIDLVGARVESGAVDAAQELLEAIALVQSDVSGLEALKADRLAGKPKVQDAHAAVVRLARWYVEEGQVAVSAREVLRGAAAIETVNGWATQTLDERVWDRPFDECYEWAKTVQRPRQVHDEIGRALSANQPFHARRLTEAVLVKQCNAPLVGSGAPNLSGAATKFLALPPAQIAQNPVLRSAVEHLVLLTFRTNHPSESSHNVMRKVLGSSQLDFVAPGAPLEEQAEELQRYFNGMDPYNQLRVEEVRLEEARSGLRDDERAAQDDMHRWFSDRMRPQDRGFIDQAVRLVAEPAEDAMRAFADVLSIEEACGAGFRAMMSKPGYFIGDVTELQREGARLRADYGTGSMLMSRAREVNRTGPLLAAAVAGAGGLLPPGIRFASGVADLTTSLWLAWRAIGRVGALYGYDLSTQEGWQYASDCFALGCADNRAEGLLAYLSRGRRSVVRSFTHQGVLYDPKTVAGHLWAIADGLGSRRMSEQLVRHLSRLCGLNLSQRGTAKLVPIVGAILSGVSAFQFVESITEASIYLATRERLLARAEAS